MICFSGYPLSMHCFLLYMNRHCGSQNSLSCWQTQSFLYLWSSCHYGNTLLQNHLLCLFTACILQHCHRQHGKNCLHTSNLHTKSCYLQPEKQRHETRPEEAGGQEETPGSILLINTQEVFSTGICFLCS